MNADTENFDLKQEFPSISAALKKCSVEDLEKAIASAISSLVSEELRGELDCSISEAGYFEGDGVSLRVKLCEKF